MKSEEQQRQDNDLEMEAWNAWKRICSVLGLKEAGHEDYYAVLSQSVVKTFKQFFNSYYQLKDNYFDPQDIITEFDIEMWRKNRDDFDQPPECGIGNYKDWIFFKADNSKDPNLKVVRGEVKICIRNIVKQYIRENFFGRERKKGKKTRYLFAKPHTADLGKPTDDDTAKGKKEAALEHAAAKAKNDAALGDAASKAYERIDQEMLTTPLDNAIGHESAAIILKDIYKAFDKAFDLRDKILFVADCYIHANDKALLEALGIQKSACAVAMNKMRHKKEALVAQYPLAATNHDFQISLAKGIIDKFISDFSPEKKLEPFLSLLATKLKGENHD